MKNSSKILTGFLVAGFLTGCYDKLDVTNPNAQTFDTFWQTPEHALEGVNAIYSGLIVDGTYMRMLPACTDGRGDDFRGVSPWPDLVQFSTFTIPAVSAPLLWVWRDHYQVIYRANQALYYIPGIEISDTEFKQRLLGQAYFLRGLAHFNLAINFKAVPVITELPNEPSKFYPPTASEDALWAQIIADFAQAKSLLPQSYNAVVGPDAGNLGRVTKGAATGMLGKAYLYRQQWSAAHNEFNEIIMSNQYSLVPNFRDNFKPTNENNEESLFEVQFSREIGGTTVNWCCDPVNSWMNVTAVGYTYAMPGFGFNDFNPSRGVYDAFKVEATTDGALDPRLFQTITSYEPAAGSTSVYGQPWPQNLPTGNIYTRKYTHDGIPGFSMEGGGTDTWSGINYRVLRFADVLLMDAEALNEMGSTAQAAPLIQRVRDRANLPDRTSEFAGLSQQGMRDQIAHERYLELAIEGVRIHDIIRWGWFYDSQKLAELRQRDPDFNSWGPGKEYLPIPQGELDTNPNLLRNPAN